MKGIRRRPTPRTLTVLRISGSRAVYRINGRLAAIVHRVPGLAEFVARGRSTRGQRFMFFDRQFQSIDADVRAEITGGKP